MADIISYLYKIVDKASPILKDIEKQSEKVNDSLLKMSGIKYPTQNLSTLKNELQEFNKHSKNFDKFTKNANKLDVNRNAFQNAIQGAKRFRGEMRQSLNSVARLNRDLYALSVGAVGGGTTSSIHRSLMEVSEFEKVLKRVKSLAGDTADDQTIPLLKAEARRVMKETPFALDDISNAINVLMKNGVQATDITDGYLDAIAKFSTVAEADFGRSADLATDVMAMFKDEGLSVHDVMNTLAAGMYTSKFGFEHFAQAIAKRWFWCSNFWNEIP